MRALSQQDLPTSTHTSNSGQGGLQILRETNNQTNLPDELLQLQLPDLKDNFLFVEMILPLSRSIVIERLKQEIDDMKNLTGVNRGLDEQEDS